MERIDEHEYELVVFSSDVEPLSSTNDNVDIEVILKDGSRYSGTLFTLENLASLMNRYQGTGECHNGLYFGGCRDMIIVRELTIETIKEVVAHIYRSEEIPVVLNRLEEIEEEA